jgi:hypothetical protein
MSGLYSHRAGMGMMVSDYGRCPYLAYAGDLSEKCVTIAEALKAGGILCANSSIASNVRNYRAFSHLSRLRYRRRQVSLYSTSLPGALTAHAASPKGNAAVKCGWPAYGNLCDPAMCNGKDVLSLDRAAEVLAVILDKIAGAKRLSHSPAVAKFAIV